MKTVFISERLRNNICSKMHLQAFESLLPKIHVKVQEEMIITYTLGNLESGIK